MAAQHEDHHILPLSVTDIPIEEISEFTPIFSPIVHNTMDHTILPKHTSLPNRNLIIPFSTSINSHLAGSSSMQNIDPEWYQKTEVEMFNTPYTYYKGSQNPYAQYDTRTNDMTNYFPSNGCDTFPLDQFDSSSYYLPQPIMQTNTNNCYPATPQMNPKKSNSTLRKRKRKNNTKALPQEARKILKTWILENWENPYPDEATKKLLIVESGLSRSQVINWFINARRRLIRPLKLEKEKEREQELSKTQQNESSEEPPTKIQRLTDAPDIGIGGGILQYLPNLKWFENSSSTCYPPHFFSKQSDAEGDSLSN